MLEISASFIGGCMVGIEFPSLPEDVAFGMVLDLVVIRLVFTYWKQAK